MKPILLGGSQEKSNTKISMSNARGLPTGSKHLRKLLIYDKIVTEHDISVFIETACVNSTPSITDNGYIITVNNKV